MPILVREFIWSHSMSTAEVFHTSFNHVSCLQHPKVSGVLCQVVSNKLYHYTVLQPNNEYNYKCYGKDENFTNYLLKFLLIIPVRRKLFLLLNYIQYISGMVTTNFNCSYASEWILFNLQYIQPVISRGINSPCPYQLLQLQHLQVSLFNEKYMFHFLQNIQSGVVGLK